MAQRLSESRFAKGTRKVREFFYKLQPEKRKPSPEMQERLNDRLIAAAESGDNAEIKRLLKAGAKIRMEAGKYTALMGAAMHGHTETCALLLKNGANINARTEGGMTVFMWAGWRKRKANETAEFLTIYLIRKMLGKKGAEMFISSFRRCVSQ
jgi:hypothetical protein